MSTLVYARRERLHPGLLDKMVAGGAEAIEVFGARGHFHYSERQHVREIANWFRGNTVTFHSMHAPMHGDDEFGRSGAPPLNIAAVEKRDRIAAMDEIKRAIEVAEHAPFQFLVQHVGVSGESASGQKMEAAMTSLEHLRAFAKPLGVQVVVENIPNELSTPEGLVELLHTTHFTDVGVCFDVGHANMAPGIAHAFAMLKDLIRTTHVHDNHGERDEHLWPGQGKIDWKETVELLRTAPHVPALVLEIEGMEGEKVAEKMAEAYGRLDV
ncbi:MAG TPA: sugar phosphate isomerase/epimerase family protein [Candidatus Eisenbacteria bacterium]|nr:sugar phosphate isomerase/epimerase family protein [Candidatus Eisenbacteria bacterium]